MTDSGLPNRWAQSFSGLPQGASAQDRYIKTAQTATFTLSPAEAGGVILLGNPAAVATCTLPPVASCPGANFEFLVSARPSSNAWTIFSSTAVISGGVLSNPGSGTLVGPSVLVASSNTGCNLSTWAAAGTRFKMESDGTNWWVSSVNACQNQSVTGAFTAFS